MEIRLQLHKNQDKYRPDIDGLRAIAVLSVVAFHAFPSRVKGGFIGVDVFFVISGYLISTIIFENLENGTFSFREFYSRRIRRIFPALLVVLTVSCILGWFTLLANEYKQFGKHIVGGIGFISNFVLWKEAGYFDNAAETKPLLHLWSLGIEEQFYFFYPLVLWFAWKKRFNLLTITILIAIISFYLNVKGIKKNAIATFFLPHTRFWELMCGSLLAWLTLYKNNSLLRFKFTLDRWVSIGIYHKPKEFDGKTLDHVTAFIGLMLFLYGLFRIKKEMHFPGTLALIPVISSILIILAGQKAWVNKHILSNRLTVWFGLISFPLYLWHWLLLSFSRIIQGTLPDRTIRISIVILSVFLSWLTYKFIERPLRFNSSHSKFKIIMLLFFMILFGFIGYGIYLKDGLTFRKDAYLKNSRNGDIGHTEYHKYIHKKYFLCTPKEIANDALTYDGYIRCMQSKPTANVDIALIGDSHAEHLFIGMAEALPNKNIVFYNKDNPPFLDNPDFKKIYKYVLKNESIKTVVLTMYWTHRYSAVPKGSTITNELIKVIDALSAAEKNVYLTDDIPVFPFDPEKCKGTRRFATNNICTIPYNEAKAQKDVYLDSLIKVINERPSIKLLSLNKYLCNKKSCSMVKDNFILYRDHDHLNINGSFLIGKRLVEDNYQLFK